MAASQTEICSQLVELSTESLNTFCSDISTMFETDIACSRQQVCAETIEGLKNRFKNLAAVISIKAQGQQDGTFHLVFDRQGLFILSGIALMQAEKEIRENIESGTLEKAGITSSVFTEIGLTLVGAWDRVSRNKSNNNNRFVQTNTFIGEPWDKSQENIGLSGNEEFMFIPHQITINPYPAFQCGSIFPKITFAGAPVDASEPNKPAEEKQNETAAAEKTAAENPDIPQESNPAVSPSNPSDKSQSPELAATEAPTNNTTTKESMEVPAQKDVLTTGQTADPEKATPELTQEERTDNSNDQPISEAILKITQSPATLPGEQVIVSQPKKDKPFNTAGALAVIQAKDVMQKNIVWAEEDETVQQALTKMQQHKVGYIMIGADGTLDGIISKSDIAGAISPYLRPAFEKWRRPLDDATLQIRLKWILSKPVHTTRLETSLMTVIEDMCRLGWRAIPVLDQQDNVHGLITVFDILKAVLYSEPALSIADKPN